MEAEELRKDFPIFGRRDVAYLDNAATSQKPEKVIEALEDFYRSKNSNVGRGLYELASEATVSYRNARKDLASFTGVSEEEIVFVRGCTEGMNLIASSLDIEGDVAVSELSHHSEQLPWREHLGEEGVKYLPVEHGVIDVEEAERIIDSGVSVVCVSHVSNVFGTEQPVDSLVDIAHDNDALVVLDAAQSVPHMPVDFRELDVDFAVFSGHKMLGPTGIGVIYGRRELLERMEPYQVGGGMVDSVKRNEIDYAPIPEKFEAGTPNIAGAVGLSAAV
ncbi:MAG: aminotransferase class V-fold PLP-dependent enzyme, partial [Candidatus Nanohaloarchaea archaeon]